MAEIIRVKQMNGRGYAEGHNAIGRPMHVWGALPGELVAMHVTRRRGGATIGVVESILEPSPHRVPTTENHYLSCSPWQVMTIDYELELKRQMIQTHFAAAGIVLPPFIFKSPEELFGYRNKMEFSFTEEEGALGFAFFERAGRNKTALTECLLSNQSITQTANTLLQTLIERNIPARALKMLMIRANARGQTLAGLYTTRPDIKPLERGNHFPEMLGISTIYSDPKSPASKVTTILGHDGEHALTETILDQRFVVSLASFFQVNVPMFEQALLKIREHISTTDQVLDMYSGVGTIGLSLDCAEVTLVETDEFATALAEENAAMNRPHARVLHATAETALEEIKKERVVMVDPPRPGLHPKVVKRIQDVRPPKIIYLSCNAETQARDISQLLTAGYALKFFEAYNFFPRTPHTETLAVLEQTSSLA